MASESLPRRHVALPDANGLAASATAAATAAATATATTAASAVTITASSITTTTASPAAAATPPLNIATSAAAPSHILDADGNLHLRP